MALLRAARNYFWGIAGCPRWEGDLQDRAALQARAGAGGRARRLHRRVLLNHLIMLYLCTIKFRLIFAILRL